MAAHTFHMVTAFLLLYDFCAGWTTAEVLGDGDGDWLGAGLAFFEELALGGVCAGSTAFL